MDLNKKLDADIPADAIEKRSQGGKELSYLSGAYVINRLNEVLGQGNWSYGFEKLEKVFEGTIAQYSGDAFSTSYIAQVQIRADINGKTVYFTEVGYGDGTDKKNPGKAHELAVKEAVTDGLKRAAKNLGRSMGLGLYFKGDMYVSTTTSEVGEVVNETGATVFSGNTNVNTGSSIGNKRSGAKNVPIKVLKGQIKSAFAVLQDQKKITKEDWAKEYSNNQKVDDMDQEMVTQILTKLSTNYPELGLTAGGQ